MFKRLLVPIIGNAASSVAVGFAIELAKARGGDVTFCYALDIRQVGLGNTADPSWIELLRPDAEKVGNAALARAAKAGCPASLKVIDGAAEAVVLQVAPAYDLVVIGTRAIHGFAQVLDHSVTDAIIRACTPPVLVVREWDAAPPVTPETALFRRLLVPTDGSTSAQGAIDFASALASEHEEQLLFVYAVDPARAAAFSGSYAFDDGGAFGVMERFGSEVLAKAEASARAAGAQHVSTKLLQGDPVTAILAAIKDQSADAVVMGTHGRVGLDHLMYGSVTEDLIRKSPVPIVVLHAANVRTLS